jgi:quinol monooxygenase YgiN
VFGLVVRFDLAEESIEAFDALAYDILAQVRSREPGTLVYACHEVRDTPLARIFYELYEDERAFEAHEQQDYVKHFLQEREKYLTSTPRVEFLNFTEGKGIPAA